MISGALDVEQMRRWCGYVREMASSPEAVLVTGVFGVGKSTIVADLADLLEAERVD